MYCTGYRQVRIAHVWKPIPNSPYTLRLIAHNVTCPLQSCLSGHVSNTLFRFTLTFDCYVDGDESDLDIRLINDSAKAFD